MDTNAQNEIERKIKELTEIDRVITNGLNWLSEIDVKVAYMNPVNEFIGFLQGFKGNIAQQRAALESTIPKPVEEASRVEQSAPTEVLTVK